MDRLSQGLGVRVMDASRTGGCCWGWDIIKRSKERSSNKGGRNEVKADGG